MSITMPDAANMEPGEIPICTLPLGSVFTLGKLRGVVIHQGRGSTQVSVQQDKFRVITAGDGTKSKPIRLPDRHEHWCLSSPVVPTGETVDLTSLQDKAPTSGPEVPEGRPVEGDSMTPEGQATRAPKAPKAKKTKAKAAPKKHDYQVVKYEATAKVDTEKGKAVTDAKKDGQGNHILRFIVKEGQPTFAQVYEHMKGLLKGKTVKTVETNTRWYLSSLAKQGYIKSVTDEVAASSREEAVEQA